MRIVEVIPSLIKRAGAEVFFSHLCIEMKKKGCQILPLCLYDDKVHGSFVKQFGVNGINLITSCNKKRGFDYHSAKEFRNKIKHLKPDVVHLHLDCIVTYFLAFGFKRQPFSIFLTVHSIASRDGNLISKYLKRKYFHKHLIRPVGISNLISRSITTFYQFNEPITIYNGTNLTETKYTARSKFDYDLIIIARFTKPKNHKMLFRCFEKLYQDNTQIKLCCIGDGPCFASIYDSISNYESFKNITFIKAVDNVTPYLKRARICCLTSFYEGNPISIIEALNCGCQILAPNVGGIPDVIQNGIHGYLFNVNDDDDFIKGFYNLQSKDFDQMSCTNFNHSKRFDISICADEYLTLFKKH